MTKKNRDNYGTVEIQPQFYTSEYEEEDYYQPDAYYDEATYDTLYAQQGPNRSRAAKPRNDDYMRTQQAATNMRPRQNPLDEFGNPSKCSFCRSIYHWYDRCPDAARSGNRYTTNQRGVRRPPRGRGSTRGGRGYYVSEQDFI